MTVAGKCQVKTEVLCGFWVEVQDLSNGQK
jgi:hypothetical protein